MNLCLDTMMTMACVEWGRARGKKKGEVNDEKMIYDWTEKLILIRLTNLLRLINYVHKMPK